VTVEQDFQVSRVVQIADQRRVGNHGLNGGSAALALEKNGIGTLTLGGTSANTYTGGTTLTGGALTLGADNALGGASGSFAFNGGNLQANNHGFSIGALSLSASSSLTLSDDLTHSSLTFSSATWSAGDLSIYNWSGTLAGGGDDKIYITPDSADPSFLNHVIWKGFLGGSDLQGAIVLGSTGELIPVPEPATWFAGLGALGILGVTMLKKRKG